MAPAVVLFTTQEDFAGWTSGNNVTPSAAAFSIDSSSINGAANVGNPGGAGTSGSLQFGPGSDSLMHDGVVVSPNNTAYITAIANNNILQFNFELQDTNFGYLYVGIVVATGGAGGFNYQQTTTYQYGVSPNVINLGGNLYQASIPYDPSFAIANSVGTYFTQIGINFATGYAGGAPVTIYVDNIAAVPEPSTWALASVGLLTLGLGLRRRLTFAA